MNENRTTNDIAAELEGVAAGLNITAQLFESDEHQRVNPKVIFDALSGYELTVSRLAGEVLGL